MVELVIVWHPSNNWGIIQTKAHVWEPVTKLTLNIMLLIIHLEEIYAYGVTSNSSASQLSFSLTVIILTFWSSYPSKCCQYWHILSMWCVQADILYKKSSFILLLLANITRPHQKAQMNKLCMSFCFPFLLIIPRVEIQKNVIQLVLFCLRGRSVK